MNNEIRLKLMTDGSSIDRVTKKIQKGSGTSSQSQYGNRRDRFQQYQERQARNEARVKAKAFRDDDKLRQAEGKGLRDDERIRRKPNYGGTPASGGGGRTKYGQIAGSRIENMVGLGNSSDIISVSRGAISNTRGAVSELASKRESEGKSTGLLKGLAGATAIGAILASAVGVVVGSEKKQQQYYKPIEKEFIAGGMDLSYGGVAGLTTKMMRNSITGFSSQEQAGILSSIYKQKNDISTEEYLTRIGRKSKDAKAIGASAQDVSRMFGIQRNSVGGVDAWGIMKSLGGQGLMKGQDRVMENYFNQSLSVLEDIKSKGIPITGEMVSSTGRMIGLLEQKAGLKGVSGAVVTSASSAVRGMAGAGTPQSQLAIRALMNYGGAKDYMSAYTILQEGMNPDFMYALKKQMTDENYTKENQALHLEKNYGFKSLKQAKDFLSIDYSKSRKTGALEYNKKVQKYKDKSGLIESLNPTQAMDVLNKEIITDTLSGGKGGVKYDKAGRIKKGTFLGVDMTYTQPMNPMNYFGQEGVTTVKGRGGTEFYGFSLGDKANEERKKSFVGNIFKKEYYTSDIVDRIKKESEKFAVSPNISKYWGGETPRYQDNEWKSQGLGFNKNIQDTIFKINKYVAGIEDDDLKGKVSRSEMPVLIKLMTEMMTVMKDNALKNGKIKLTFENNEPVIEFNEED